MYQSNLYDGLFFNTLKSYFGAGLKARADARRRVVMSASKLTFTKLLLAKMGGLLIAAGTKLQDQPRRQQWVTATERG